MSDTATVVEETAKKSRGSADNIINLQDGFETAAAKNAAARKPRWIKASASAKQGKQGEGYSTVRSGYAYDFDSKKSMASVDAVRAANVKAQVADAALTGIHDRVGYRFAKRTFDIAFSVAVPVLFSWLFLLIAVVIKADDPKGPVFFKQKRVSGKGEFFMYKFRSMCVDAEERLPELRTLNEKTGPVFKIAEDPRITRVGKWLCKLSLDELPQFVNVLKGDIPLRILKTRQDFESEISGVFALPANEERTKISASSQVKGYIASGLRALEASADDFTALTDVSRNIFSKRDFLHLGAAAIANASVCRVVAV